MSGPAEQFARLTCDLEDLHGIAVEGQAADQPNELLAILANQICNGLQLCVATVDEIKKSVRLA